MRRRGVFGYNLPPRTGVEILPADFGFVGLIGRFDRGFDEVIVLNNKSEADYKAGDNRLGFYGRYVLDHTYANLKGVQCKIGIKGYVASDAVQAKSLVLGKNTASAIESAQVLSAFQLKNDKSIYGNKLAFSWINGDRFKTTMAANSLAGATSLLLTSISDIRIGDVLRIGSVPEYVKVLTIDETLKAVGCAATTNAFTAADDVAAIGFKISVFKKNRRGLLNEVKLPQSTRWLSLEPQNIEFYIGNQFKDHPLINITDSNSSSAVLFDKYPADITKRMLTGGSDGTAPSSSADWNDLLASFDSFPIRLLGNADSTVSGVNVAGEAYCTERLDTPVWISNITKDLTKDELITVGNGFQRSDQVQAVLSYGWRNVSDPIGDGANPVIRIPNIGGVMGNWIKTFYRLGFHRVPAGEDSPMSGYVDTPNLPEDSWSEDDRTDLLAAGINLIQARPGKGVLLRSFRTLSTNVGALFGHYLIMQNFFKISTVESLSQAENRPNKLSKLKEYGQKINDFGYKCWQGSFPFGIDPEGAFGSFKKEDGTDSTFADVFIVQADEFNNDQAAINVGEGDIATRFYPPPLLESLAVGVGVVIPLG